MNDPRNDLFSYFFRLVAETEPAFFLAENVPGILSERYAAFRNAAFSFLDEKYVVLEPVTVRARDYGAATDRTRVFFVGYDPRKITKPLVVEDLLSPVGIDTVCVRRALAGLPTVIDPLWQTEEQGIRSVRKPSSVNRGSFEESLSGKVPQGVGDPEVLANYACNGKVYGCQGTVHAENVIARFRAVAPGKCDSVSRAVRLDPDGFCPTLRAGTGKERGSYQAVRPIHYREPRVITPREAARLQGFPDWFVFHATKWHSFRQIGNSVCPLIAEKILNKILNLCI